MGRIRKFIEVVILTALFALFVSPTVSAPLPAATGVAAAQDALNRAIAVPNSPLPAGTKLYGVQVVEGLATVNFSRELRDNFHGGDSEEASAVSAILTAAGRDLDVKRVQILVEGRPVDSLGGLIETSQPLPVPRAADSVTMPARRYLHRQEAPHKAAPSRSSRT